jgi:hypothetical protein
LADTLTQPKPGGFGYMDGRPWAWQAGGLALALLAMLSKQEAGLAIGLVYLLACLTGAVHWRVMAAAVVAGGLVGLALLALFSAGGPEEHALFEENLMKFAGAGPASSFFQRVAGLDAPEENLSRALLAALGFALLAALANYIGRCLRTVREGEAGRILPVFVASAACLGLLFWLTTASNIAAAPLLAGVIGLVQLARNRRDVTVLFCGFVLASAIRIPLKYTPLWYGFALAAPVYPWLIDLFGRRIPQWFSHPAAVRLVLGLAGLLIVIRFEIDSRRVASGMSMPIETAKGVLYDYPIRAEPINEFLAYLQQREKPADATMVVLPEGVSLNYFAGLENPTAYYLFIPPEIPDVRTEHRMLDELEATRPDFMVINSRNLDEFGVQGLGHDYGQGLLQWTFANYDLEREFQGAGEPPFRIFLFARVVPAKAEIQLPAGPAGFPPARE